MKKDTTIIGTSSTRGTIGTIGFIALICLFVSSCSKDDGSDYSVLNSTSFEVVSYMTPIEEAVQQTRSGEGLTRAWSKPSGFVDYEGGYQPIGACFTQNGQDPNPEDAKKIGSFFYSNGKWRTNVELTANADYYLYGYIPHMTVIKTSITDLDGYHAKYDEGAKLTLRDVPTAMPNDLCVVIGAKHGTDKETVSGLRMGDFGFTASQGAGGKDFVFLLFDHLYSALTINMRVYGEYDKLRTIKLKSLKLRTKASGSLSTDKTDITISLKKTTDGTASPIEEITYTPVGESATSNEDGVEFWPLDPNVSETLTTDFAPFVGHFMPKGVSTLILTSIYDVYDKEGKLVRENCKATNTMSLSELYSGQDQTLRGNKYIVNMTIRPTYLYIMSDPDLENPGMDIVITE